MRNVQPRQYGLDQLLAELPLHEAVGNDQPDIARPMVGCLRQREIEKPLGEGGPEPIFHMAALVDLPIRIPHRRILRRDVGRVADDGVILAPQQPIQLRCVLVDVMMLHLSAEPLGHARHVVLDEEMRAVKQAVAHREGKRKIRRGGKTCLIAGTQRGQQQAEPGDLHGEGVQVDAGHAVQRALRQGLGRGVGINALPLRQQAGETAQQEMPGAAGRVDHSHPLDAELPDRRIQGAREDPVLDEVGRLQQGKPLAGVLGEVLVEVAEKARAEVRVGEVVHQRAGLGHAVAEEGQQRHCAVAGDGQAEQRVVGGVIQAGEARQPSRLGEGFQQEFGVAVVRAGPKEGALPLHRQIQPLAGAGEQRAVEQAVVLQEAQEHEAEQPVHGRLVEGGGPESLERVGGAPLVTRLLPLSLDRRPAGGDEMVQAKVVFDALAQLLQVGQQTFRINHNLALSLSFRVA